MSEYPIELRIDEVRKQIGKILEDSGLSISIVAMLLREAAKIATEQEQLHLANLKRKQGQRKLEKAQ